MSEAGQQPKGELGCHTEYFKSISGILKPVQVLLDILVLILSSIVIWSGGGWSIFVGTICLIGTLVHSLFHLLGITDRFRVPRGWNFIEFCGYSAYTLLYFIAAVVIAALSFGSPILITDAIFAFLATAAYGTDAALLFMGWRRDLTTAEYAGGSSSGSSTPGPAAVAAAERPPDYYHSSYGEPSSGYGEPSSAPSTTKASGTMQQSDSAVATGNDYSTPSKW